MTLKAINLTNVANHVGKYWQFYHGSNQLAPDILVTSNVIDIFGKIEPSIGEVITFYFPLLSK